MTDRPNLILIYTDQQRWDTIRALGADWMVTPTLDRLCAEGVAYTHATTPSPVCMPARWSLHTGQWPSRHGCYSNHHPGPRPAHSLPGILRDQGYRTGLVGKNHTYLGQADFDTFVTAPERLVEERTATKALAARREALRDPRYARLYPTGAPGDRIGDPEIYKTEAAIQFLKEDDDAPFFLWLSYLNPHTPYVSVESCLSRYRDRELPLPVVEPMGLEAAGKPFRQLFHRENTDAILPFDEETIMTMRRVYYSMISLVDEEIGRLLAYLDRAGLRENTLVVFTSDHGDYMGDHGLLTKSPALYDCLVRVPFIARWPGTLPQGELRDDFVSHIDILPAFVNVAGGTVPAEVDGRDFLTHTGDDLRTAAYAEYGIPGRPYDRWAVGQAGYAGRLFANPGNPRLPWEGNPVSLSGPISMIRTREWKLVMEPNGTDELYNLVDDPGELVNLAGRPESEETKSGLRRRCTAPQHRIAPQWATRYDQPG